MPGLGSPILLEGSFGEGGGALLRTGLVLAAMTQQLIRISNIRGGTKYPGLNAEDLTLAKAVAQSCRAETVGLEARSSELSFLPTRRPSALHGQLEEGVSPEPSTSQSLSVILVALLPLLARSGAYSTIRAQGETYGNGVLSYDAFQQSTLRALSRFGLYAASQQLSSGFGRGSRGEVELEIEPSALHGVDWPAPGRLRKIGAALSLCGLSSGISERGVSHLQNLAKSLGREIACEVHTLPGDSPGAHVCVWAECDYGFGSGNAMGQKGMRIESAAQSAFDSCMRWLDSNTSVDTYLADQILMTAALAEGESTFSVQSLTQRTLTTVWVIKQLLPIRLTVKGQEGKPGLITIRR